MGKNRVDIDINAKDKTRAAIANVNRNLKKLTGTVQFLRNSMVGLAGSYLALRTISSTIASHREFTKTVSNLSAITGIAGNDLIALSDRSRELGKATTLSASQVAESFKLIASAQPQLIKSEGALDLVTTATIQLAEAASIDMPDAANALTLALNQYGASAGEATKFVDVLAAGAKYGSSEIAQTAEALVSSGLVAKSAGTSFAELNTAIQLLAKSGVKGREAGTGLRNIYLNLAKQSKSKFKPEIVGLTQALNNLNAANLSSIEKLDIFGKKNIVAAKALISQSNAMAKLNDSLNENGIALKQAFINTDNLDGDIKRLASAFEELQLSIGESTNESLRDFVKTLSAMVTPGELAYDIVRVLASAITGLVVAKVVSIAFSGLSAATTFLAVTFSKASISAWTLRAAIAPISLLLTAVTVAFTAFNYTTDDAANKTEALNKRIELLLGNFQAIKINETKNAINDLSLALDNQKQAIVDYVKASTAGGSPFSDSNKLVITEMAQVVGGYENKINQLTVTLKKLKDEAENVTLTSSTNGEADNADEIALAERQSQAYQNALSTKIKQLRESLYTEDEALISAYNKRRVLLSTALTDGLIDTERHNELKLKLEADHQQKLNAIKYNGMTDAMKFSAQLRDSDYRNAIKTAEMLTAGLASSSREAFEINKVAGISNAIINTSTGITKALAELAPPYSYIAAGITAAQGYAQVRAIQSRSFSGGGGSAPSLTGTGRGASETVNTLPIRDAINPPPNTEPKTVTKIIIAGNVYGFDDFTETVAEAIREVVNDRDVIIVDANSRQAQEIREGS